MNKTDKDSCPHIPQGKQLLVFPNNHFKYVSLGTKVIFAILQNLRNIKMFRKYKKIQQKMIITMQQ